MAETGGQEKTEQPSGKRLTDTREQGQVAKSMEINSLAIFTTGLLLLYLVKNHLSGNISGMSSFIFSSLDTLELNMVILRLYAYKAFLFFIGILAPVMFGLVCIALIAGYGQVGFKITLKALAPKMSKFNPIKGMKNKFFSSQSFVEFLKSFFKLIIIGGFAYWVLSDVIISNVRLVDYTVEAIVTNMVETAIDFLWKVAVVYAVLAAADFAFQKYKHKKDIMMTKQEVKDEVKQTEGDPLIKSRIKGQQISMARTRMMQEVPKADVVITNPNHYAVALKYEMGKNSAPKVVAKGMDFVAQKIKEIAKKNNVHLHEDVELARALYKACNVGDEIPEKLFKAVAQILAYVFQLKKGIKKKSIV